MISRFIIIAFLSISFFSKAQDDVFLKSTTIPLELKENANAVLRFEHTNIDIQSTSKTVKKYQRIVCVLNKRGNKHVRASLGYDNSIKVKGIGLKIYDANGLEIKHIKRKDFKDVSAVDSGTLYSDSRGLYADYVAISYPYTAVFEYTQEFNDTASIPSWFPLEDYYISTELSSYTIHNDNQVPLISKTYNFEDFNIASETNNNTTSYKASKIKAFRKESFSPIFTKIAPKLGVVCQTFKYKGISGDISNWSDFGKWMYQNLLKDRGELNESTVSAIKARVSGVEDPLEKAKIVFKFVQENTRYISVQVGIGGIQPISAGDVDKSKYGDCKGLSNYTMSLLNAVGVKAYYTHVEAGGDKIDIERDFVSLAQGNHVILYLNHNGNDYWIDSTSQTIPFGFIANFTDDRDVVIIKPEGGEIKHTKIYSEEDNLQTTYANASISKEGSLSSDVTIKTFGLQYGLHEGIQSKTEKDRQLYYKNYWSHIDDLSVKNIALENDKNKIVFNEAVSVSAENYAVKSGDILLMQPNAFNKSNIIPKRYKERQLDFEIERGFIDKDEFVFQYAPELNLKATPEPYAVETKFGTYSFSIEKTSEYSFTYKRTFKLNKGSYPKEEYAAFRTFLMSVAKYDNTKVVLTPKT